MSGPGAIDDIRVMCARVEHEIPLTDLSASRAEVGVALEWLRAVGDSRDPDFLGAVSELDAIVAELDTAHLHLRAAASHIRAYRGLLG